MTRTYYISDIHFSHNNSYKFLNNEGTKMRPFADNADDGDQILIDRWNSVVNNKDKVYVLGDVAIPRRGLKCLEQLKGRKILVKGNHDLFKLKEYVEHFEDICGMVNLPKHGFVLTHAPTHPHSLYGRWRANIHGHLHHNIVWKRNIFGVKMPDHRYFNVSVESPQRETLGIQMGEPIDFEVIKDYLNSVL